MILPFAVLAAMLPVAAHAEPGANGGKLAALQVLEPGEWELRSRNPAEAPIRLCASDIRLLLQPQHPSVSCSRFVVEDGAKRATVTYDCAAQGQGRTSLRVETARLVQIDSQGVSNGLPFALLVEGRRVGACKASMAGR